jgi:hypothetical protein
VGRKALEVGKGVWEVSRNKAAVAVFAGKGDSPGLFQVPLAQDARSWQSRK